MRRKIVDTALPGTEVRAGSSFWRIPNMPAMPEEISKSFKRSERYGIDTERRSPDQFRLSPELLQESLLRNKQLLEVVDNFIGMFSTLLEPDNFMINVVDRDGYILKMYASEELWTTFMECNCGPGFRWTERDVGTSAISLCLELQAPFQVARQEHYCKQAHGFISSAVPIVDSAGGLIGILASSGPAEFAHPHTLVMMLNIAAAIGRELHLQGLSEALRREAAFLQNTIDGVSTGVMLVAPNMDIMYLNKSGRSILKLSANARENLAAMGMQPDPEALFRKSRHLEQVEISFSGKRKSNAIQADINPVYSGHANLTGYLINFEAASKARLVATKISGSRAYFTFDSIIGKSPLVHQAITMAQTAALTDMPVLLRGETGSGKELFAQAIHNATPQRRNGPFVPINCAAIPSELLESELFGYAPGAFSGALPGGRPGKFELADGGTIFLDEVGDMPLSMQAKLLRVLQSQEVYRVGSNEPRPFSARIISGTHVDLPASVEAKLFREDLFFRLGVFPVSLPSLRERGPKDILLLAEFFLGRLEKRCSLSNDAKALLVRHKWPGNVRELENVLQLAASMAQGGLITPEGLFLSTLSPDSGRYKGGTLSDMEKRLINDTMMEVGGNMVLAAKKLGISRATLYRKKKEYGL